MIPNHLAIRHFQLHLIRIIATVFAGMKPHIMDFQCKFMTIFTFLAFAFILILRSSMFTYIQLQTLHLSFPPILFVITFTIPTPTFPFKVIIFCFVCMLTGEAFFKPIRHIFFVTAFFTTLHLLSPF